MARILRIIVAFAALVIAPAAIGQPSAAGATLCGIGDSITAGAVSTARKFRYMNRLADMLGRGEGLVVSGHPGYTSQQIEPFLGADILGKCDTLVMLEGTNDAGQSVPLDRYSASMLRQMKAAREAGIELYVMTIPPRYNGGGGPAIRDRIDRMNDWLRKTVSQYGRLVDLHNAVLDPTTGYMNAKFAATDDALASGMAIASDTTHFSNAGHNFIAMMLDKAIEKLPSKHKGRRRTR